MSWGDVWVSGAELRPSIDGPGPQAPWTLAGVIGREERAIIEAVQRLRDTRGQHARAVDFYLQVHDRAAASFEPDGRWVAIDLTADDAERPRFIAFTQRVHPATSNRPAPAPGARRPLAVLPLRGRARSGASAIEWAFRAPVD